MKPLQTRIREIIGLPHLASLATVTEDGRPWVRYVMPCADEDLTIRMSTYVDSRKINQIRLNPEVHLTCGVLDPLAAETYLQIQGRARFSTEPEERHGFWSDLLSELFEGPDDPRYGIVIVTPYRIELHSVGQAEPEVWTPPQ